MKFKFLYGFSLIFLIFTPIMQADCDKETYARIIKDENKPYAIFNAIESTKVAAFATDNPIKKGFDDAQVKKWNSLLDCCFDYTMKQIQEKKAPRIYMNSIHRLQEINNYVQDAVNDLQRDYKANPLFAKSTFLSVKKNVKNDMRTTQEIFSACFKNIITSPSIVSEWQKAADIDIKEWKQEASKSLQAIFPHYETFFITYEKAKALTGNDTLAPSELGYFLQIAAKMPYRQGKKLAEERAAEVFLDKLEKFSYKLEQDLKSFFGATSQKKLLLQNSSEIIEGIKKLYPQIISKSYRIKLTLSKDAASVMLLAISGALNGVLNSIKLDINKLLKK